MLVPPQYPLPLSSGTPSWASWGPASGGRGRSNKDGASTRSHNYGRGRHYGIFVVPGLITIRRLSEDGRAEEDGRGVARSSEEEGKGAALPGCHWGFGGGKWGKGNVPEVVQ